MDSTELKKLGHRLGHFLRRFDGGIKTAPSRAHFRTYIKGQLSDLERKSVTPIALQAGVAPRSLQEFLEIHRWDQERVRLRLQEVVMQEHASAKAIGVIDETSDAKKGEKTAGVARQYCGATGKPDNCVVTVHLGYVTEDFHALVDSDLFLPQETWAQDRQRCRAAGIPATVVYRPKWRIGLDLVQRSWAAGVRFAYLVADEAYGRSPCFRQEVASYGVCYGVELPGSLKGWTKRPATLAPGKLPSTPGRVPTKERLACWAPACRRVDRLWQRGGPSWEAFHLKNTDAGPVVWEVRMSRFYPWEDGLPGPQQWLLVARQVLTGEVKYFLSTAAPEVSREQLLHVAFSRAHIERLFEDAKGQVGLDQCEVRHYQPLMRHLILSMVSLLFLVRETARLGKKRLLVECPSPAAGGRAAA